MAFCTHWILEILKILQSASRYQQCFRVNQVCLTAASSSQPGMESSLPHSRCVQGIHERPKHNLSINGCTVLIGCCIPISSHLIQFIAHLSYTIFNNKLETTDWEKKGEWKNSVRENNNDDFASGSSTRLEYFLQWCNVQNWRYCGVTVWK